MGKAPQNTSPYYHRGNRFGVFVSKPGANVYTCPDGDLIFDSTRSAFLQPIAKGYAKIPKATYKIGLFGEEGVINNKNWNTADDIPELNSDTSWFFDAVKSMYADMKSISDDLQNPTGVEFYGSAGGGVNLDVDINQNNLTLAMAKDANASTFLRYGDTIAKAFVSLGDFSSDRFIKTMLRDLWRIYHVFPFLEPSIFFGQAAFNFSSIIPNYFNVQEFSDSAISDVGSTHGLSPKRNLLTPAVIPLRTQDVFDIAPTDFYDSSNYIWFLSGLPGFFKSVWTPSNILAGNLEDTAYPPGVGGATALYKADKPSPWNAWTTEAGGVFNLEQEAAAIAKFMRYSFICSWIYHNYSTILKNTWALLNGGLAGSIALQDTTPKLFNAVSQFVALENEIVGGHTVTQTEAGLYLFKFNANDPPNAKPITDFNIHDNSNYSFWDEGEVVVDTQVAAPNGIVPHVWWNSISRKTTNAATNLSFLNIPDNRIKTSEKSKRAFSLRPGLASVQANTFVGNDGNVRVRFFQPSVFDSDTEAYFTVYKETATFAETGSVARPRGGASYTLDIRNLVDGGNSIVDRKSAIDGRYYTCVFPDDFVGTKGTTTDPFRPYRDGSGRINQPLTVTLVIPSGVVLSGQSFHNHIKWHDLQRGGTITIDGVANTSATTKLYGPLDTSGRSTREIYAAVDPCIKLNMSTTEFTSTALNGTTISIENFGTMVGAGGYGMYGQLEFEVEKYQTAFAGGGGGGGAGYHPSLVSENPDLNWIGADGITDADRLDEFGNPIFVSPINTTEEIDLAKLAVVDHWDGPENYVEWGIGGDGGANTYFTGFDQITWLSLGPGKAGTGYLGSTIVSQSGTQSVPGTPTRPYGPNWDRFKLDSNDILRPERLYSRVAGTYLAENGDRRFYSAGWGVQGLYGTQNRGGSGGDRSDELTGGYHQYNPPYSPVKQAGSGGSCVYVYRNTAPFQSEITGFSVSVLNKPSGIMKAGGGGGSGGIGLAGLDGGNLGRPGKYLDQPITAGKAAESGQPEWSNYSRRGEPGRIVWWNAPDVTEDYTIENLSTSSSGSIEGMDTNPATNQEDYVSYLPDVQVRSSGVAASVKGQKLFSRGKNAQGEIVYTDLAEKTYVEYITDDPNKEFV